MATIVIIFFSFSLGQLTDIVSVNSPYIIVDVNKCGICFIGIVSLKYPISIPIGIVRYRFGYRIRSQIKDFNSATGLVYSGKTTYLCTEIKNNKNILI